jgi:hypothetical protein
VENNYRNHNKKEKWFRDEQKFSSVKEDGHAFLLGLPDPEDESTRTLRNVGIITTQQ